MYFVVKATHNYQIGELQAMIFKIPISWKFQLIEWTTELE